MENRQVKCWLWTVLGAAAALALWHGLSVRDGAVHTGRMWLVGVYCFLLCFTMVFLGMWGWLFLRGKLKLEQAFLILSLSLGLVYMAVLPPLSAPDEVSHYISAYELSSKIMGKEAVVPDGRVILRPEDAWIEDMEDVLADDGSGPLSEEDSQILGQEVTQDTYQALRESLKNPPASGNGDSAAVSYQPPVRTTPLAYVPQALGMALARSFGLGSLGLLMLGRLCNLLFYGAAGYYAIGRAPFGKEVFFGAGILPLSLHLAASLSYDVMIIALTGVFLSVCLDLAYEKEKVFVRDIVLLAAILAVMGPCKMVYGIIAGFCLLVPVRKFGSWGRWCLCAGVVLGAFCLAMVLVNRQTVALYTGETDPYVSWAEEAGYSFAQLLHNPVLVFRLCYNTLAYQGQELFLGMMGGSLGNMDPVLNTPFVVILCDTVLLGLLAMKKQGEELLITWKQKIWLWFLCFLCLGALMFSMLLAWTPVSAQFIQGVQGRYLLPLLPVFLLTLKNRHLERTGSNDRLPLYLMAAMDGYVILRVYSIVCLRV